MKDNKTTQTDPLTLIVNVIGLVGNIIGLVNACTQYFRDRTPRPNDIEAATNDQLEFSNYSNSDSQLASSGVTYEEALKVTKSALDAQVKAGLIKNYTFKK